MENNQMMTILVVEDDVNVREQLIVDLKELGFKGQIFSAENGRDAFMIYHKNIRANGIDFIISDIDMPVESGIEFLKSVRSDEFGSNIPVLMLTSHEDRETILACSAHKASNYIVKPWGKQILFQKINTCIDKHSS